MDRPFSKFDIVQGLLRRAQRRLTLGAKTRSAAECSSVSSSPSAPPHSLANSWRASLLVLAFAAGTLVSTAAQAQEAAPSPPPSRSGAWSKASNITAISALGLVTLMPRVFYSDPEVTVGWKARFHVSVLAPSMALAAISLLNEQVLKDKFKGYRPGCSEELQGSAGCNGYGMFSSPTFTAFSALGQGTGIFLTDTLKWSGGRFNFGPLMGDVLAPGILSVLTAVGRTSGNWESGGQVWGTAGVGLITGLGLGVLYATMQRPECGYTGSLICW